MNLPEGMYYRNQIPVYIDPDLDRGNLAKLIRDEAWRVADKQDHVSHVDAYMDSSKPHTSGLHIRFHCCCSEARYGGFIIVYKIVEVLGAGERKYTLERINSMGLIED